jgi:CHAD domain-containing protein
MNGTRTTYVFVADESVPENAHRILDGLIDEASGLAAHPEGLGFDASVHALRTTCKRARALLRLFPGLDGAREVDRSLRDVARIVAPVRDARVSLDTIDELQPNHRARTHVGAIALRAGLEAESSTPIAVARLDAASALLAGSAPTIAVLRFPDDPLVMAKGVEHTYRRGRRAFKRAREGGSSEDVHAFRKWEKYRLYQAMLLDEVVEGRLAPLRRDLQVLSDDLGRHHDLTVLIDRASDGKGSKKLLRAARAARAEREREIIRVASALYAEPDDPSPMVSPYGVARSATMRRRSHPTSP